jgi:CAAX protease family protein
MQLCMGLPSTSISLIAIDYPGRYTASVRMDLSSYFLLPDGRLRSGWRVLIFLALYLIAAIIAGWLFYLPLSGRLLAYSVAIQLAATAAPTWLMLQYFDRRPFFSVGLSASRNSMRELAYGFGLGIVMGEAVIVVEITTRLVMIGHAAPGESAGAAALVSSFVILLVGATAEELLFRGYPFQRLVDGTGPAGAIAISSIVFGVLHARNPDATALSVTNTVLAGILLSLAYLRTRALWLPIGFHFAWNWMLATSGFPVSGLQVVKMPWRALPVSGSLWPYGGSYGPEGGLIGTAVLVLGITFLVMRFKAPGSSDRKLSGPVGPAAGIDGSL